MCWGGEKGRSQSREKRFSLTVGKRAAQEFQSRAERDEAGGYSGRMKRRGDPEEEEKEEEERKRKREVPEFVFAAGVWLPGL